MSAKHPTVEQELETLREKLYVLENLPRDFRDLSPGSQEWAQYSRVIPESKEAMDKWASGPIICYGRDLDPIEEMSLKRLHSRVTILFVEPSTCQLKDLMTFLENAEASGASFIYLKGFGSLVPRAINWLASFFKLRVRVKGHIVPE